MLNINLSIQQPESREAFWLFFDIKPQRKDARKDKRNHAEPCHCEIRPIVEESPQTAFIYDFIFKSHTIKAGEDLQRKAVGQPLLDK